MFVTSAFYETTCYKSFVNHRGLRGLAKAHKANSHVERIAILDPLRGIHGMPSGIADAIESALTIFDEGLPLGDRASFVLGKGAQAIKMAVHWDATGPVGAAAKLVSATPDLAEVTYPQLEVAARAIIDGGIAQDLPSPLLKTTVLFIEAIGNDSDWAVNMAASCVATRLGTKPLGAADPTQVPEERVNEVYKKVKEFLGAVPKSIPLPQWFHDWKAQMDAKKKAAEAAADAAAKAAEAKRLEEEKKTAEDGAAATAAATGATTADAATPPTHQAFEVGSRVNIFSGGKGVKGKGGKSKRIIGTGKVDEVLSKHCWVKIDAESAVDPGTRKRLEKTKLQLVNESPQAHPNATSATGAAEPSFAEPQPDPADAQEQGNEEANAWQACSDVFG